MMGIVNFQHEIRDRELQLMHRQPSRLRRGRETMARSQIKQDVGGLPDHELAGFEEWRRERRGALRASINLIIAAMPLALRATST